MGPVFLCACGHPPESHVDVPISGCVLCRCVLGPDSCHSLRICMPRPRRCSSESCT